MVWNSLLLFTLLVSLIVEMRHCFRMHNDAVKMAYKGWGRSSTVQMITTTRFFSIHHPSISILSSAASADDMTSDSRVSPVEYKRGQLIKVKVISFGPMGASVSIAEDRRGLILQKELAMFRDRRDREQVVVGEVLDGYVERVRETGNVDVSLRPVDVARIEVVKKEVMEALGMVLMMMMIVMIIIMMMMLIIIMIVVILIFQSIVNPHPSIHPLIYISVDPRLLQSHVS